ncbi:MAG: hypothetical protein ACI9IA_000121 [Enterobacterales bacterium]|jgi:hypothetical protein
MRLLIMITCLVVTISHQAAGNRLIEAIMRSDFIFDRNLSNVPFIPLAYLNYNQQHDLKISDGCVETNCDFDYQSITHGLALPVWVGEKNMFLLGETLESRTIERNTNSINVDSGGVLAAWVSQPSEKWQAGAFVYSYRGIGDDELAREPRGNISGAVARYRHSSNFHSYWGLIHLEDNNNETIYPYIGFDWYIGDKWSVSGLIPWPTVQYAPTKDVLYKFGALYSGAEWAVSNNGEVLTNDFEKWDFGFAYEHRLWNYIWGEIAVGYSGLGKFSISSGTNIEFDTEIESAPFIKLALNIRFE